MLHVLDTLVLHVLDTRSGGKLDDITVLVAVVQHGVGEDGGISSQTPRPSFVP